MTVLPNLTAHIVLYSYPLVVFILFRKLRKHDALIWSILLGYLFLPAQTGIDLPLLPQMDKVFLPAVTAAIMCLVTPDTTQRRSRRVSVTQPRTDALPESVVLTKSKAYPISTLMIIVLLLAPVGAYLTNMTPFVDGVVFIPGLRIYDVFSQILNVMVMLLPFFLARQYLNTPQAAASLLKALVITGLVYSVLCLVEVRLSPQLNRWIYGFHAHSFAQHIRGGGYRPMLFVEHGLRVGIFMAISFLAAITLFKAKRATVVLVSNRRGAYHGFFAPYGLIALWLFGVLVLIKSLGALIIAVVLLPVLLLTGTRVQLFTAAVFAALVLLYPMMRSAGIIPTDRVYELVSGYSIDRAQSYKYRLDNEDILLEKAAVKPVFGWGGWGRARIYDPRTGRDTSTSDGIWIIIFGNKGWIGYIATFSLLCAPILAMLKRREASPANHMVSGLALILAANLIDLIPNSALTPVTWMLAGTLTGYPVIQRAVQKTRRIAHNQRRQSRPV